LLCLPASQGWIAQKSELLLGHFPTFFSTNY
jgi:hypothetical protein